MAKRRDQRGVWRVVHIDNYSKATLYQVKFSEQAKMLSQWIDQVGDLIDSRVLPDIPRGLVRSLYMVVSGIQSSGVKRRPSFPCQSDVMRVLHDYFKTNRSQSVTMLPHFTLASAVIHL